MSQKNREKVHSAYGEWLAYVMNARRVNPDKLAKKAGISRDVIDDLIYGRIAPERAREEIDRIGQIILTNDPKNNMERVLKALDTHADLRNWSASCDAGCCSWNTVTEIGYLEE